MIWNDELPTKEGKYLLIDLAEEDAGTRHEVEIFRKDIELNGTLNKIATGSFTGFRRILGEALLNSLEDPACESIVMDWRNDHIIFKNVLHVRLDDGREMPLFEADGMNLWSEVK